MFDVSSSASSADGIESTRHPAAAFTEKDRRDPEASVAKGLTIIHCQSVASATER